MNQKKSTLETASIIISITTFVWIVFFDQNNLYRAVFENKDSGIVENEDSGTVENKDSGAVVVSEQEANGFEANQNNVSSIANPYIYAADRIEWLNGWMRAEKLKEAKK